MNKTARARAGRLSLCRRMAVIVAGGVLLPAGGVVGQYANDFETMAASTFGEVIWGQDSFYNPVDGSLPGLVYTYAGNLLELPPNPGGGDNFVGSTGGDPAKAVPFSRAQRDIEYGGGVGAWTVSFDFAVTFVGTPPAFSVNAGSFSLQPTATNATFIALPRFPSVDDTSSFGADMVWYDFDGIAITEPVPNSDFQGLLPNHWYRWSITFAFDSNRILEVKVTDLATGDTFTHLPT
ncbi:MAG: hypothetical protein KJO43_14580, partial [Phycisphaerae bacterium]|nr:hypothetical protein [Phycisphaerae bacterium]